jgi:hypothetical protein
MEEFEQRGYDEGEQIRKEREWAARRAGVGRAFGF